MKTLAIISEFNPFHNGHKYLLEKSKEITKADISLTIMSGDFVQRGEPAIIDKFRRSEAALRSGFDLVIEMPSFVSLQSASFFARKNVEILSKLKIDYLCFGIENISSFDFEEKIQKIMSKENQIEESVKNYLDQGYSYTKSSYLSLENILGEQISLTSNNILAFEYVKAIKDLKANIKFIPIERISTKNKDKYIKDSTFASSTAIRNHLGKKNIKNLIPKPSFELIQDFYMKYKAYPELDDFYKLLRYKILIEERGMEDILCFEKGMDNLFYKNLSTSTNFHEFLNKATSTRFTSSRIRRLALNYLLENKENFNDIDINFVKVLACNDKGMNYLSKNKIKKIINKRDVENLSEKEKIILNASIKASNLYNMNLGRPIDFDFIRKFILK